MKLNEIELMMMDKGYLPYSRGECYGKQITVNSYIFIQKIKDKSNIWTGYRITYDEENNIKSEKTIFTNVVISRVLGATERYIKSYINFIKKGELNRLEGGEKNRAIRQNI